MHHITRNGIYPVDGPEVMERRGRERMLAEYHERLVSFVRDRQEVEAVRQQRRRLLGKKKDKNKGGAGFHTVILPEFIYLPSISGGSTSTSLL